MQIRRQRLLLTYPKRCVVIALKLDPTFIVLQDSKRFLENARTNGFAGPVNWYKVIVSGIAAEDDKSTPFSHTFNIMARITDIIYVYDRGS